MSEFRFNITFQQAIPKFVDASVPLRQCAEKIVEASIYPDNERP